MSTVYIGRCEANCVSRPTPDAHAHPGRHYKSPPMFTPAPEDTRSPPKRHVVEQVEQTLNQANVAVGLGGQLRLPRFFPE